MAALAEILQKHPIWRGGALAQAVSAIGTGFAALDAQLPGGGWPRQGLTELLANEPGIGELGLILPAFAGLTGAGRRGVWIAPPYVPYAPALAAAGIDLAHLLVVQAVERREALWAAEQALRSGSCHALAAWLPRPRYAELQRLAVAAEAGAAIAFVFRPWAAAGESSPAGLRLGLEPAAARLAVHLLKRRGAPAARPLHLDLERPFHVVGRASLSGARSPVARAARRLGLPVHA